MKRFYKNAAALAADGGFAIELDGRPVRTPRKALLAVPSERLANAIAGEWQAQGEEIRPTEMPMLRLANTAIDVVGANREEVVSNLAGFGGTDLLCYRASRPTDLVARQSALWDPLLDWVREVADADLEITSGVGHIAQDPAVLQRLHGQVAAHDNWVLAALNDFVTISGSLVIGLAVVQRQVDVEAAWTAARVDEDFQAERWGLDHEAAARADALKRDFVDAMRFIELL